MYVTCYVLIIPMYRFFFFIGPARTNIYSLRVQPVLVTLYDLCLQIKKFKITVRIHLIQSQVIPPIIDSRKKKQH